jgi:hypothetical protein
MPTNTEIQAQIAQLEANIVALTIQLNPAAEAPKPPGLIYSDATSYSVYTRRNGKTAQMSVIERVSLPTAREEATALHRRYKTLGRHSTEVPPFMYVRRRTLTRCRGN